MSSRSGSRILICLGVLLATLWVTAFSPRPIQAQEDWKNPDWLMDSAKARDFFKRDYLKIKALFRSPTLTAEQARQVKQVAQYYLSMLTHDEIADPPKTVIEKFYVTEFAFTLTSPAVRQALSEEIVARAEELLKHPNELVRYNALAMVVQLNVKPQQNVGLQDVPAVPYAPAHKLLLEVVKDTNQLMACRILAARGLTRICRDGEGTPSSPERSDIAQVIVDTLNATPVSTEDGIRWFRARLIETLGSVDRIDNTSTSPIVIEALLDVVANRKDVIENRALAAQCLTQLPFPASTNVPLITDQIMKLLEDLCAGLKARPNDPRWHESFLRVYLAFRPSTTRQAKDLKWGLLYQVTRSGLTTHAEYVKGAWAVAFPILRPFVEKGPTAPQPAELKALADWLKNVDSSSRRIVPNGKEYSGKSAVVATGSDAS